MWWQKSLPSVTFFVCLLLLCFETESRRYGGRSKSRGSSSRWNTGSSKTQSIGWGGSNSGSSGLSGGSSGSAGWGGWALAKPKQSSQPKQTQHATNQYKPSAPPNPSSSFIQHEKKQQSAPSNAAPPSGGTQTNQRPIGLDTGADANKKVGWNVDSAKPPNQDSPGNQRPIGWNVGDSSNNPSAPKPGVSSSSNQQHVSFVNNQPGQTAQKSTANTVGNHPNGPPPPYQQYPNNAPHPNGPPPPYQQYPTNNAPHYNAPPPPYQQYPNSGYNPGYQQPHYPSGGYPGYGGYHGGFGGGPSFGGSSFGGLGGGGYNYGLAAYKPRSSWGSTISNVLAGAFIWHLVSGLVSKPYTVYNYNNKPDVVPPKMELPPNLIMTCPDNVTSLCAPSTFALCTTNHTIMCVASANQATPCGDNANVSCITTNAEVPVPGTETPLKAPDTRSTNISLPCISNATVLGTLQGGNLTSLSVPSDILRDSKNGEITLCVTTVAVPQTEEEIKAAEEAAKKAQAQAQAAQIPCPPGQVGNSTNPCLPPPVSSTSSTSTSESTSAVPA